MKIGTLTLLCLLPFVVISFGTWLIWRRHHEWHQAHRERERVFRFWRDQCAASLHGMKQARTDVEYQRWNATMRVNMRRYEKEVLHKP